MTDEQERLLSAVHATSVEVKTLLIALDKRFSKHEEDDEEAHKRLASLEATRDQGKFLLKLAGGCSSALAFAYWVWQAITSIAHAQ